MVQDLEADQGTNEKETELLNLEQEKRKSQQGP
jgi:hypothetical protein